jgi:hypothetical protein
MTISATTQGLKICNRCKTEQALSNYSVRLNGKYLSRCRRCLAKASANYRDNNREKYLANKRAAYKKRHEKTSCATTSFNWDNLSIDQKQASGCGIYCITISDYFYIGSCVNFNDRMYDHTRKLGYGKHVNRFMQNAFNKYKTFDAELIEPCAPSELASTEQRYIDQWFGHKNCLNLRPNVKTMLGFKHSEETKKKLSTIFKGVNSRSPK